MTTPHKATPEQWAQVERFVEDCGYDACLLELRDRLAAAEKRISELEATPDQSSVAAPPDHFRGAPEMVPDPADELVEQVMDAITDSAAAYGTADEPARAAILAVAEWFDAIGYGATASILRQELQRSQQG